MCDARGVICPAAVCCCGWEVGGGSQDTRQQARTHSAPGYTWQLGVSIASECAPPLLRTAPFHTAPPRTYPRAPGWAAWWRRKLHKEGLVPLIHLTIKCPTKPTYVHVGRERSQRFSYNSPDIFLVSIDRPSWSSIESEILFLVLA